MMSMMAKPTETLSTIHEPIKPAQSPVLAVIQEPTIVTQRNDCSVAKVEIQQPVLCQSNDALQCAQETVTSCVTSNRFQPDTGNEHGIAQVQQVMVCLDGNNVVTEAKDFAPKEIKGTKCSDNNSSNQNTNSSRNSTRGCGFPQNEGKRNNTSVNNHNSAVCKTEYPQSLHHAESHRVKASSNSVSIRNDCITVKQAPEQQANYNYNKSFER